MTGRKSAERLWFAFGCCTLLATYLFWPHSASMSNGPRIRQRIAPRTSPSFDKRPKNDAFIIACAKGDLKAVQKFLDSGVSPDSGSTGEEGVSALSAAASDDDMPVLKLLIQRGADVNDDNFWGGNALVDASLFGQVETVKFLIAHGADPNMEDDGVTALDYASHQLIDHDTNAPLQNYREIVEILRSSGGQASILSRPIVRLTHLFSSKSDVAHRSFCRFFTTGIEPRYTGVRRSKQDRRHETFRPTGFAYCAAIRSRGPALT